MSEQVLIVDDEANMRWVLAEALKTAGFETYAVSSGQEALARLGDAPCDLVILDQKLKGMDGLATLRRIRERWPQITVLLLTAYGTVTSAVEAMQLGAADYLRKPFDVEELLFKIQRALERRSLQADVERWRSLAQTLYAHAPVGSHPRWQSVLEQVRTLSQLRADLFLIGEAGTGKTELARWSHTISPHKLAPLIELDVAPLSLEQSLTLLEGAQGQEGARVRAGAGSLLLRHVSPLWAEMWEQVKHLLALPVDSRPRIILTGVSSPPDETVPITLHQIHVPSLREHGEDLIHLARVFAPTSTLTLPALQLCEHYSWPGNIAEFRHVLQRAATLAQDEPIEERHLPERVRQSPVPGLPIQLPLEGINLEHVEIALLRQAVARAGGNKTRAAELLGLTRHTLLYRLEKYGISEHKG